jgi:hypothetical protein
MNFVAQGCYPESLHTSNLLLRLLCWGVSAASRHAGCPVTQGRTLDIEMLRSGYNPTTPPRVAENPVCRHAGSASHHNKIHYS